MLTFVERALVSVVKAKLALDATLADVGYDVRGVRTSEVLNEDRPTVFVRVTDGPRKIGPLREVMVDLIVSGELDVEEESTGQVARRPEDLLAMLELAMEPLWDTAVHPTVELDLKAALEAQVPNWTSAGFYVEGWTDVQVGEEMTAAYRVKVGVMKI